MKRMIFIDGDKLKEATEIVRGCIMNHDYVPRVDAFIVELPNCYCVRFHARQEIWDDILLTFDNRGIHLLY